MKVDLHVHASERSDCAVASEESMIRAAQAAGLDALVFTDHHRLVPAARLVELNEKFAPFRVYSGIEITTQENEDCLVIGVQDPILEQRAWDYASLVKFVRSKQGFLVLAHPFRYGPKIKVDLAANPPDAIEIKSQNTPRDRENEIRQIAAQLNLALVSNSDAHSTANLGKYFNEIPASLDGDRGLVDTLTGLKPG